MGGEIEYIKMLSPVYHLLSVTVLDVVHSPVGPVFMGKSAHARIRLRGCFSKIVRLSSNDTSSGEFPWKNLRLDYANSSALSFRIWPDFNQKTDPASGVFEEEMILLYLTPNTEPHVGYQGPVLRRLFVGHFERIGWMMVFPRDTLMFHLRPDRWVVLDTYMATLPKKTVTIV